jgi:molybdopterin-guanine dinucleotide biosynthesis protein A
MGGADKATLRLAGRSLAAHAVDRLEPQVERLAISANGDPARLSALGLPVLADAQSQGPLSGVLSALDWAAPLGATAMVTAAVDTPFFPGDLVPRLILGSDPSGIALARSGGNDHPTFAIWPVTLRDDLRAFLDSGAKASIRAFADARGAGRADFPEDGAFMNLNTPDDLSRAEVLIRGAA